MHESDSLRAAYNRLAREIEEDIEPYEVVSAVESHRNFWRPNEPRVILLAESHVRTTLEELEPIKYPADFGLDSPPDKYVRFIYCLAHGEKTLTPEKVSPSKNPAQFWKILYSCVNPVRSKKDFLPVLAKTATKERIANKVSLLLQLKKQGIWLLDASIAALYSPGGRKPTPESIKNAIEISWDEHVCRQLKRRGFEHVICIGVGVRKILNGRIDDVAESRLSVIPQPQGWRKKDQDIEIAQQLREICEEHVH